MRYFEFQDFERKFEECISQSAVKTKFEQHSSRGKSLSGDMCSMLDNIHERTTIFRNLKMDQKTLLTERIQGTETQMMQVTRDMKLKIHNMVEEVEQKVSKALNEEIWRLGVLIDEFNMPFHPEPLVLNIYKKELNSHVESGLGSNLRARLSMALAMNVEAAQREMTGKKLGAIAIFSKMHLYIIYSQIACILWCQTKKWSFKRKSPHAHNPLKCYIHSIARIYVQIFRKISSLNSPGALQR